MTPRLDDYGRPECQFADCEAEAETTREHPRHGEVQVCSNCAELFDVADSTGGSE